MPEDNIVDIRLDSMRSMIEAFPRLLTIIRPSDSIQNTVRAFSERCAGVCLVGMGGSAIAGEMSRAVLEHSSHIPLISIRSYDIPAFVDERWATIAVSYSGDTEETIHATQMALKRDSFVIGVTSGGRLSQILDTNRVNIIVSGFQPRAALPLLFSVIHPLLEELCGIEKRVDLFRVAQSLERKTSRWGADIISPRDVAIRLLNSTPLFIGPGHLAAVAYRAKCQVNENAKRAALFSEIPELNHNEIEALRDLRRLEVIPIILRSSSESERMRRRLDVTVNLLERNGLETFQLKTESELLVEECLAQVHYLDTLSLELAELVGTDPLNVDTIKQFKTELGNL